MEEMRVCFFFVQAEDGIRDATVTGVQTCALPISYKLGAWVTGADAGAEPPLPSTQQEIGRASCRESVDLGGRRIIKKKKKKKKKRKERRTRSGRERVVTRGARCGRDRASCCCHSTATIESVSLSFFFFFFQAEDGIRDATVTGVQTCALPIMIRHTRCYRDWSSDVCSSD